MVSSENLTRETLILTGPTAVGKSSFAMELALELRPRRSIEIINADSVSFYRHFNLGSAKPTLQERQQVPHHLIDRADPLDRYHAGQFHRDVSQILQEIHSRGSRALIVGGSGFYLKALRYGLWDAPPTSDAFRAEAENRDTPSLFAELQAQDPARAEKIASQDRYRIIRALEILQTSGSRPSDLETNLKTKTADHPHFPLWVVDRRNDDLDDRIRTRAKVMLESGWIEEVRDLRARFPESRILLSVGYRQVVQYLDGIAPQGRKIQDGIVGLLDEICLAHRQLAKQQRTFFKGLKPEEQLLIPDDQKSLKEKLIHFYQG